MAREEPNLIISSKGQKVFVDGYLFSIKICRLENEQVWTLAVDDCEGTSHVWDHRFETDIDALNEAVKRLETEGAAAFMRGNNVIPFR
ncbi:hypothetical protein [Roseovarius sp. MMSF_3448]|uniref:hypothetical protein n=1 Tax=Roseovarius sp. MMSF_3448 TaxID=3046713 RepID=UPI00273EE44A|nr:hypothetical protein [Roseovarius sp. MMSF_3448]